MGDQIKNKIQRLLAGEFVVCSDLDLDGIEETLDDVRSIPNPNQMGTLDRWLCWVMTLDQISKLCASGNLVSDFTWTIDREGILRGTHENGIAAVAWDPEIADWRLGLGMHPRW